MRGVVNGQLGKSDGNRRNPFEVVLHCRESLAEHVWLKPSSDSNEFVAALAHDHVVGP